MYIGSTTQYMYDFFQTQYFYGEFKYRTRYRLSMVLPTFSSGQCERCWIVILDRNPVLAVYWELTVNIPSPKCATQCNISRLVNLN